MVGHSGFEYFASKSSRFPSPLICTTFHDLHHSQFHYNYGNFFSFWDRICGTVHPKYDVLVRSMEETGEIPDSEETKVKATG
jgi:sterol desaturase/sphingolipid hydroxylase (fatty acid hydroxylase superfamily)